MAGLGATDSDGLLHEHPPPGCFTRLCFTSKRDARCDAALYLWVVVFILKSKAASDGPYLKASVAFPRSCLSADLLCLD